jgi:hypothetical protein
MKAKCHWLFSINNKPVLCKWQYAEPSLFLICFHCSFCKAMLKGGIFTIMIPMVITEKAARKFFGDEKNVLGKSIRV